MLYQFNVGYTKFRQNMTQITQGLWEVVLKQGKHMVYGFHVETTRFEFLKIQGVVIAELYA